jgi:hypothetical protein
MFARMSTAPELRQLRRCVVRLRPVLLGSVQAHNLYKQLTHYLFLP